MRSFKWKAKQGKLRSVVELVESSRATRQGRRLAWSGCLVRHTSLTHAGARQKSHGVVPPLIAFQFPAPPRLPQLFHHSLHLHFIRSQNILQSSFQLLPARIPATNLYIRAAITPPTQSTRSPRAVPRLPDRSTEGLKKPIPYLLSPSQPLTRNPSHAAYQGRSFFWAQLSCAQRLPPSLRRSSEQTLWRHGKHASDHSRSE